MRNQIMADYVREPRARLFEKMIEEGTSTAPVQHWAQGLGNVSKALVGAYMAKKLKEEYDVKEGEAASERSLATQFAMGMPAETQTYGDTTINWNEQKPDFAKAAGVLKSPYNADFQGDIFNAQIQQNQTDANQEFLRQQQAQQFAQQRQLAEMTAQRQISAQDAMLNRQLEFEKWKQENDPISKILASGGSPQLGQVIPQQQGVGAAQVQEQGIPQINASELQPNAPLQQSPQQGIPKIDPQIAVFNSALAAKGLKAPDGFMYAPKQGGGLDLVPVPKQQKPLPASIAKYQTDLMGDIQSASGTQADLSHYKGLLEQDKMNLGAVNNALSEVRNYIGKSTPESINYSSFMAALEKMRNDSLRLNKGVQTEGDSQRAWNELIKNITDKEVVKQRLEEVIGLNKRAAQFKQDQMNQMRGEFGREPLDVMGVYPSSPLEKPAPVAQQGGWGVQRVE